MSIHCNFYLVVMGRKKYLALRKGRYRDGGCTSNQPGNDECDRCMCYNLKQIALLIIPKEQPCTSDVPPVGTTFIIV